LAESVRPPSNPTKRKQRERYSRPKGLLPYVCLYPAFTKNPQTFSAARNNAAASSGIYFLLIEGSLSR
jgi:hypothetical protein